MLTRMGLVRDVGSTVLLLRLMMCIRA